MTGPMADPRICTVEAAAAELQLHPRTVLRYIREGRLKATRIGKAYRINRSDLAALAGLPAAPEPDPPSVTSIVEIPGIAPELGRKWALAVTNALGAKPVSRPLLRADVIYDPERRHLKIVIVGSIPDTMNLMGLIRIWQEQLTA